MIFLFLSTRAQDSLLNSNPDFDYTLFRELADKLAINSTRTRLFGFGFTTPGTYVFYDAAEPDRLTYVSVMQSWQVRVCSLIAELCGVLVWIADLSYLLSAPCVVRPVALFLLLCSIVCHTLACRCALRTARSCRPRPRTWPLWASRGGPTC